MIPIRELRLFEGLAQKAYKTEEEEQKLLAAEEGVHGEFKKWRVNYSENRLCKTLLEKRTKKPRTPGFFSF